MTDRLPDALPDVLRPGIQLVFIGTAAGQRSHEQGAYYAKNGNCFWSTLYDIGLTDRQLQPKEFEILAHLGIGLTDICKKTSGVDTRLGTKDFYVDGLVKRLCAIQPRIISFNGKKAASIYFDCDTRDIDYGRQTRTRDGAILNSIVFVLPSTSGSAKKYWDPQYWRTVAEEFRALRCT
jgi:double-stranded uracil-DNA glycosylase